MLTFADIAWLRRHGPAGPASVKPFKELLVDPAWDASPPPPGSIIHTVIGRGDFSRLLRCKVMTWGDRKPYELMSCSAEVLGLVATGEPDPLRRAFPVDAIGERKRWSGIHSVAHASSKYVLEAMAGVPLDLLERLNQTGVIEVKPPPKFPRHAAWEVAFDMARQLHRELEEAFKVSWSDFDYEFTIEPREEDDSGKAASAFLKTVCDLVQGALTKAEALDIEQLTIDRDLATARAAFEKVLAEADEGQL